MESQLQSIRLSPEMIVLIVLGMLLFWQMRGLAAKTEGLAAKTEGLAAKTEGLAAKTEGLATKAEIAGLQARFESFREDHGIALSEELFEVLHTATFALLDKAGHPVCCGFFVSPCGVALTAAHGLTPSMRKGAKSRLFVRAVNYLDIEFELDVAQEAIGELDIAVLRLRTLPESPVQRLTLPSLGSLLPSRLREAPVHLVHGNIAYSKTKTAQLGQDRGHIVAVNATCVHYNISTMSGHSGAALIMRGQQLIALHTEVVNDVPDELSHSSPSTHGEGIRLDLPSIHAAVKKYAR